MPYIPQEERDRLGQSYPCFNKPGQLNYMITDLIKQYIYSRTENYTTYNDILGVLEAVKLELYRRKIAPYEDTKIQENGDVY